MYKNFASKFVALCETQQVRLENDGFLVGDYVEFKRGFNPLSHPFTKVKGEDYLNALSSFMKDGLPLRVKEIHTTAVPGAFGKADATDAYAAPRVLVIQQETMPVDRIIGVELPVPSDAVKRVEPGSEWGPGTKNWFRDDKVTFSPEEVKSGDTNHSNPKSNISIAGTKAKDGRDQVKQPTKR